MAHVLVVDDEQSICWSLARLVTGLGHTATTAASAEQALSAVSQCRPDCIVLDVRLPGMDGLTAIEHFRAALGSTPIIVITAFGDLAVAVDAVRKGAFEYLVKPFELAVAQRAIERAVELPALAEAAPVAAPVADEADEIVGSSPAIQEVFKQIAVVAPTDACVHLHGASGTGKELVARAIHRFSRRAAGPFVPVNLAALSPSLAESELFGHLRGAFTGAEHSRKGLLEQAHGGTIFFDEVADIPIPVQVKLLRVLEYGEILPVGATEPVRSDFRVITATHQDLRRKVAEGKFRHDLYFRLVSFEIEIPPLAARAGDVAELARHFLTTLAAKNGAARPTLTTAALAALEARPWHGNVRELRNALEHALIVARGGAIMPEHLPPPTPATTSGDEAPAATLATLIRDWTCRELDRQPEVTDLHERLMHVVEPPLLKAVLQRNGGQFLASSKQLGLHRVTLRRKVNQLGEDIAASE